MDRTVLHFLKGKKGRKCGFFSCCILSFIRNSLRFGRQLLLLEYISFTWRRTDCMKSAGIKVHDQHTTFLLPKSTLTLLMIKNSSWIIVSDYTLPLSGFVLICFTNLALGISRYFKEPCPDMVFYQLLSLWCGFQCCTASIAPLGH